MLVRLRYSTRNPGQVTGYAVALPGDTGRDGGPVWYGGGKLAADLTWPRLSQRWTGPARTRRRPLTAAERNAIWEHAARAAADAAAQIRALAGTDPAAAADAAWAASDTLHVAAAALGSRILRQAADAYDRAARAPYGRIPPPTPAGNQLRHAARLISAFAYLTGDPALAPVVLLIRLAALAEAVADAARGPAARRPGRRRPRRRRAPARRHPASPARPAAGPAACPHHGHPRRRIIPRAASPAPAPQARTRAARRGPGRPAATPQDGTSPAARPCPLTTAPVSPCWGQNARER